MVPMGNEVGKGIEKSAFPAEPGSPSAEVADQALSVVKEQCEFLIFFHLGSDAVTDWRRVGEDWELTIEHSRVLPFRIRFPQRELEDLARSPERVEEAFLEYLVRHRRS